MQGHCFLHFTFGSVTLIFKLRLPGTGKKEKRKKKKKKRIRKREKEKRKEKLICLSHPVDENKV